MNAAVNGPILEIVDAVHRYGAVLALDNVSLTVGRGEFLTILGESGSGKTTMLRLISGLEQAQSVKILNIEGKSVIGKPPAQRSCTTVFQNYALFPHMSVEENVAYGLKVRGVPNADALTEARRALAVVRLDGKAGRRISQLSGGEKQRVALARAFVTQPSLLLLDEPLAALDEKLRIDMQSELVEIQRALGVTFVYITHSREEALTMSDRIILMQHGRIQQVGQPVQIFDRPDSLFAAEFMGFENVLKGVLRQVQDGIATVQLSDGSLVRGVASGLNPLVLGESVGLAVRAERLRLSKSEQIDAARGLNVLSCTPTQRLYRGKYVEQSAQTSIGKVKLRIWDRVAEVPDSNAVVWEVEDSIVLPVQP